MHYALCNVKLIQVTNYIKLTFLPHLSICLFKWSRNFVLPYISTVLYQSPPMDSRCSQSSLDITSVMVFVRCIALFPYSSVDAQTYTIRQFHHSLTGVLSWQCPPQSHRVWVISTHAPFLFSQCPPTSHRGWVISAHAPVLSSQCPPTSHRDWVSPHAPVLSSQCPLPSRRGWVISTHAPVLFSQCPPPSHRGWVISVHAPVLSSQCPPPSRRGWVISTHAPFLFSQCPPPSHYVWVISAPAPSYFFTMSATITSWLSH